MIAIEITPNKAITLVSSPVVFAVARFCKATGIKAAAKIAPIKIPIILSVIPAMLSLQF